MVLIIWGLNKFEEARYISNGSSRNNGVGIGGKLDINYVLTLWLCIYHLWLYTIPIHLSSLSHILELLHFPNAYLLPAKWQQSGSKTHCILSVDKLIRRVTPNSLHPLIVSFRCHLMHASSPSSELIHQKRHPCNNVAQLPACPSAFASQGEEFNQFPKWCSPLNEHPLQLYFAAASASWSLSSARFHLTKGNGHCTDMHQMAFSSVYEAQQSLSPYISESHPLPFPKRRDESNAKVAKRKTTTPRQKHAKNIHIEASVHKGKEQSLIQDNPIGISMEERKHICKPCSKFSTRRRRLRDKYGKYV